MLDTLSFNLRPECPPHTPAYWWRGDRIQLWVKTGLNTTQCWVNIGQNSWVKCLRSWRSQHASLPWPAEISLYKSLRKSSAGSPFGQVSTTLHWILFSGSGPTTIASVPPRHHRTELDGRDHPVSGECPAPIQNQPAFRPPARHRLRPLIHHGPPGLIFHPGDLSSILQGAHPPSPVELLRHDLSHVCFRLVTICPYLVCFLSLVHCLIIVQSHHLCLINNLVYSFVSCHL